MIASALFKECLRSGTIASLVIMPLGWLFRLAGLRIGHYGPKVAALYLDQPGPGLLFAQHLVIGWLSALPLLWALRLAVVGRSPRLAGALYGAGYYVAINSLALPLAFGDPLPWQLGAATVLPSLIAHIAFGLSLGWTGRRLLMAPPAGPALSDR